MKIELIHPLIVHFPIALLSTGTVLRFAAFWADKKHKYTFLRPASLLILAIGVVFAWIAVLAGSLAAEVIAPTLQDISVLNHHAKHGFQTAVFFSLALALDAFRIFIVKQKGPSFWKKMLCLLLCILYFFGCKNLVVTGMLGASLVYEQGAAVMEK